MCYGMLFPVSQRKMQLFEERNISAGGVLVLQHPEVTTAHHCQVHRPVAEEVSDLNYLKDKRHRQPFIESPNEN